MILLNNVGKEELMRKNKFKYLINKNKGLTLVALIITTIFPYDENVKYSNNKGFLLESI